MQPTGILDEGGVTPPVMEMPAEELKEEKQMAKFAKTQEFKKLKEHFEARIEYYQSFLPDGRPLTSANKEERNDMWLVANAIIGELKLVIQAYEQAAEAVKNVSRRS